MAGIKYNPDKMAELKAQVDRAFAKMQEVGPHPDLQAEVDEVQAEINKAEEFAKFKEKIENTELYKSFVAAGCYCQVTEAGVFCVDPSVMRVADLF